MYTKFYGDALVCSEQTTKLKGLTMYNKIKLFKSTSIVKYIVYISIE